jgi:tRNA(Arg) A34 adenosine deaminase TadA
MNHEIYLREAIQLAIDGVQRGDGGPFGAVIVLDGVVIGRGCNRVLRTNDPTAHAEVVALREACARVGNFHLPRAIVYASCEPCPMCLAACYWAQVERVIHGATALDAAAAGFADDFIRRDMLAPPASRQLVLESLLHDEALRPFATWQAKVDRQMY